MWVDSRSRLDAMRKSIACVFAAVLSLSGCSGDDGGREPLPFGPDNPVEVSGVWNYQGKAEAGACSTLFCSECHGTGVEEGDFDPWYEYIEGSRTIEQDGESLLISDHIISTAMGVEMQGSVQVYSGRFLCGRSVVDDSGATLLYTEDGIFHSNDYYESTLSLSSSINGTACKVIWSVTGRRAD